MLPNKLVIFHVLFFSLFHCATANAQPEFKKNVPLVFSFKLNNNNGITSKDSSDFQLLNANAHFYLLKSYRTNINSFQTKKIPIKLCPYPPMTCIDSKGLSFQDSVFTMKYFLAEGVLSARGYKGINSLSKFVMVIEQKKKRMTITFDFYSDKLPFENTLVKASMFSFDFKEGNYVVKNINNPALIPQ